MVVKLYHEETMVVKLYHNAAKIKPRTLEDFDKLTLEELDKLTMWELDEGKDIDFKEPDYIFKIIKEI